MSQIRRSSYKYLHKLFHKKVRFMGAPSFFIPAAPPSAVMLHRFCGPLPPPAYRNHRQHFPLNAVPPAFRHHRGVRLVAQLGFEPRPSGVLVLRAWVPALYRWSYWTVLWAAVDRRRAASSPCCLDTRKENPTCRRQAPPAGGQSRSRTCSLPLCLRTRILMRHLPILP